LQKKDFFISYNSADKHWAEWVAWILEEAQFTVYIQAWDFLPGENFVIEMDEAVRQTRGTVVILSPDYLNAKFTKAEWAAAFVNDPEGKARALIPIRVRECQPTGLLETIIHIDIVGLPEQQAHERILRFLEQEERFKPAQAPAFPGVAGATTDATYPRVTSEQVTFPGALPAPSLVDRILSKGMLQKLGVWAAALLLFGLGCFFLLRATLEVKSDPGTQVFFENHPLGKTDKDGRLKAHTFRIGKRAIKLVNGKYEYQTEKDFFFGRTLRLRHSVLPSPLPQSGDRGGVWRRWQNGVEQQMEITNQSKRLLINDPRLVYAGDWNYYDYELRFHLTLQTDAGAAWAWRVEDESNYYLCYLAGPGAKEQGLFLYVVRDNVFDPAQPEDKAPDNPSIFCHLRANRKYEVILTVTTRQEHGVKTDQIKVCVVPAGYETAENDFNCQPNAGVPVSLGTLRTKRVYFPSGSIGFRAVANEQFSVGSVMLFAQQEQVCDRDGASAR